MSPSNSPTVSVILPTHNREKTLVRSIQSVLNQTYDAIELIIVDDGSTDNTKEIVGTISDARIKFETLSAQRGAGGARNHGISKATGALFAFQDSDDEWEPDKLALQMDAMNEDKAIGVVYSDMVQIKADGTQVPFPAPDVTSEQIYDSEAGRYCSEKLGIQTCLIKRELIEQVGGFVEDLPALEDLELFIRLAKACKFKHIEKPLVKYFESNGGVSSDMANQASARKMLLMLYSSELMSDKKALACEVAQIAQLEALAAG